MTKRPIRGVSAALLLVMVLAFAFVTLPFAFAAADEGCERFEAVDSRWTRVHQLPQWETMWKDSPNIPPTVPEADSILDREEAKMRASNVKTFDFDPDDPSRIFASDGAALARSLDGGCTWEKVWNNGQPATGAVLGVYANAQNEVISKIYVPGSTLAPGRVYLMRSLANAGGNQLWVSDDDGSTFERADGGLPQIWVPESSGLEIAPSAPGVMYMLARDWTSPAPEGLTPYGPSVGIARLYRTMDAGANWTAVAELPSGGTVYYNKLKVDRFDPKRVWMGTSNGEGDIKYSADGGSTWETIPLPIYGGGFKLGVYRSSPQAEPWLLVMTTSNWIMSMDGGATWRDVFMGDGTNNTWPEELVSGHSNKAAFVFHWGDAEDLKTFFRFDARAQRWIEISAPLDIRAGSAFEVSSLGRGRHLSFFGLTTNTASVDPRTNQPEMQLVSYSERR